MVQIIEENRKPKFIDQLMAGLGTAAQQGSVAIPQMMGQKLAGQKENAKLKELGFDIEGLSPELKKIYLTESLRGQNKQKEDKSLEKHKSMTALKGTIHQLREMAEADASGLGRFGQWWQSEEALYNRAKMKTLGSDLLSYYKTLFPRGITQEEFKRIEKDYIPKPGDTISEMKGKLDGFEDLINRRMEEAGSEESGKQEGKMKFNPKNSEHVAKYKQLEKQFGPGSPKINEALAREFTL